MSDWLNSGVSASDSNIWEEVTVVATETMIENQALVDRHLAAAAARDVDAMIADYAEDVILYTPRGPVKGRSALRTYFDIFFGQMEMSEPGNDSSRTLLRRDVDNDIVYIVWGTEGAVPVATDTFLIRHGKIRVQVSAPNITS